MKKLFLFDFDGVLVDSLALYEKSVNLCLERIGKRPIETREEFLDLFEGNFFSSVTKRGINVVEFMAASKAVTPTLDYSVTRPFTDLIPVLEELKKHHELLIISSNSSFAIRLMLRKYGFAPYFNDILGADFAFSKIEKILYAMGHFGTNGGQYPVRVRHGGGYPGGEGGGSEDRSRHLGLASKGTAGKSHP